MGVTRITDGNTPDEPMDLRCPYCGREFQQGRNLRRHVRSRHSNGNDHAAGHWDFGDLDDGPNDTALSDRLDLASGLLDYNAPDE